MSETVLAIDFGTSNSLVGAWQNGRRVEALPLDGGAADPTLMRTLLFFPMQDSCFYGSSAIEQYLAHDMQGRLFRSFKSHLANRSYLGTYVGDRVVTLESMIGIFLLEMKRRAEALLGETVSSVVVGRPARYSMDAAADNFALYRMQKAIEFAGFKNFEFMPEPLAAALDVRRHLKSEKIALVGDFGGGTSDFTLIRIGPFAYQKNHVLGLDGCPTAGDALDSLLMSQRLNVHFGAKAQYRVSLGRNALVMPRSIMDRLNLPAHIVHLKEPATYEFIREMKKGALNPKDRAALERLFVLIEDQQIFSFFEAIEKTKRELSERVESEFSFAYPGIEIAENFTRSQFEDWAMAAKDRIFSSLDECLKQAAIKPADVDLVCLTGGSGKVPLIRLELERRFGQAKLQTQAHFHSVLSGLIEAAANFSAQ